MNNLSDNIQNYLSNISYKVTIDNTKFSNTQYNLIQFAFPSISTGEANSGGYRNWNAFIPGDTIVYDPLDITFILDEDMTNYTEIHDWLIRNKELPDGEVEYHDIILHIANNHNKINKEIKFVSAFPTSLSGFSLDTQAADVEYITSSATIRYDRFEIL